MNNWKHGAGAALLAALSFGAATPFSELLLTQTSPWMLAALLYLGSGLGLCGYRKWVRAEQVVVSLSDMRWLAAATLSGGVFAPLLLMVGLQQVSAASASMLLNAESVLTALIAWFIFRENFAPRIIFGMLLILAGALVLSTGGGAGLLPKVDTSALLILGPALAGRLITI